MNWTEHDLAQWQYARKGVPVLRAKNAHPISEMNKGESLYAQWLELQQRAGDVRCWFFQAMTFKLARDCRYTPDFAVFRGDAQTLVDVKGRKVKPDGTQTYWAEEDAKIKIKVAATMFPMYRWVIAFPAQNGNWEEREM
jgi:hypothetical protein